LNTSDRVLIDANFSTLWLEKKSKVTRFSLLAVLNSSWCLTAMESIGSVMGGGALKLEATHLRRLPIPEMTAATWKLLDELGRELVHSPRSADVLARIDRAVVAEILGSRGVKKKLAALNVTQQNLLSKRKK
jgi:hypothetical protein